MTDNVFNFCPECGSKNIQTKMNGRKWFCPECNFDLYNNVASAVGLVIQNSRDEILFEVRSKEPAKGLLALPGGFSNADESAEESALRECVEETGVKPEHIKYLCSFPNNYEYRTIHYKTCDLFFSADFPEGFILKPQESEVESFVWKKVSSVEDVNKLPLAFESAVKALTVFVKNKFGE